MQGAGGVGGLLLTEEIGTSTTAYHFQYDGNGNVTEITDLSGNRAASYRYDAFGNTLVATGSYAASNNYRFSTKPLDGEVTNAPLYYYAYRFYDPVTGRWPSRDPIGEKGGVNLYGFIENIPISNIDIWGLLTFLDPEQDDNLLDPNAPVTNVNDQIYDKASWHHIKQDIEVVFCACSPEKGKKIIDDALLSFSEFNSGNDVASVIIKGQYAGFGLDGIITAVASGVINSELFWVTLEGGGKGYAQQAKTNEWHSLYGVRRWGSTAGGTDPKGNHLLTIWTEAYEKTNNLNWAAGPKGRSDAIKMWNQYLEHLAKKLNSECGGSREDRAGISIDESTKNIKIPWLD
jgi:RHS repeat-associated protein